MCNGDFIPSVRVPKEEKFSIIQRLITKSLQTPGRALSAGSLVLTLPTEKCLGACQDQEPRREDKLFLC